MELQRHHAYLSSCLAHHHLEGPVIGVAFDSPGDGPWGGEILAADREGLRRLGHLSPLRLAGRRTAAREPWRFAAAALVAAGEPVDLLAHAMRAAGADPRPLGELRALLVRRTDGCESTGAGRWFDAVAALCALSPAAGCAGLAAGELEAAAGGEAAPPYPFDLEEGDGEDPFVIDLRPMVRAILAERRRGVAAGPIAARFHETIARAIAAACARARSAGSPSLVALSGGCFENRRLTERARQLLAADGFRLLSPAESVAGV